MLTPQRWLQRLALTASWLALAPALAIAQVPLDFHLEGIAGGRAPWTSVSKLILDANGSGSYWVLPSTNRSNGAFIQIGTFALSPVQMNSIWQSVQSNGFFSLPPEFSQDVEDGSSCYLKIIGAGFSNEVVSLNTSVPPLDAIVLGLNAATPGTFDLVYNAILPPGAPGVPAVIMTPRVSPQDGPGSGTSVTQEVCDVTVTLNIIITGDSANATRAGQMKNAIEDKWNRRAFFNCCRVHFVAVVTPNSGASGSHMIHLNNDAEFRSNVHGPLPAINGPGGTGEWEHDVADDNTAAHECGHLMGLRDTYKDNAKTGTSVPDPGHEHDLMASLDKSSDPSAEVTQAAIDTIMEAANIVCPKLCWDLDAVPMPLNDCLIGTSCEAILNVHNRDASALMTVFGVYATNPFFQVFPTNLTLPPGGSDVIHVVFTPPDTSLQTGTVVVNLFVGDEFRSDTVGVSGRGLLHLIGVPGAPTGLMLAGRPNPFGEGLVVDFRLPRVEAARLEIYDISGRRMAVLADGVLGAGFHTRAWRTNGPGVHTPGGIYFVRLTTPDGALLRKVLHVN